MSVRVECECGWTTRVVDAYYSELALGLHVCQEPDDDPCYGCAVDCCGVHGGGVTTFKPWSVA